MWAAVSSAGSRVFNRISPVCPPAHARLSHRLLRSGSGLIASVVLASSLCVGSAPWELLGVGVTELEPDSERVAEPVVSLAPELVRVWEPVWEASVVAVSVPVTVAVAESVSVERSEFVRVRVIKVSVRDME